jgi:predicted nucleic acid-binding protein
MKVFIDTNVLIDFVCDRQGFAEAANEIFALGYMGTVQLQTSALSYVTTMYVAKKYNYDNVQQSLSNISEFVEVRDLSAKTVIEMLSAEWKDYEDATQYSTATQALADCIVTRNKNDFWKSTIPVYDAAEFLAIFLNTDNTNLH